MVADIRRCVRVKDAVPGQWDTRTPLAAAKNSDRITGTQVVVYSVREPDPQKYGKAIRCELEDKWVIAMTDELFVLQDKMDSGWWKYHHIRSTCCTASGLQDQDRCQWGDRKF